MGDGGRARLLWRTRPADDPDEDEALALWSERALESRRPS
jgi:hypothetical protein